MAPEENFQNGEQPTRAMILIRLLWTIVYLFIFEVLKLVVQVTVLFDYIHLLVFRESNERLRTFGNRLSTYGYRILRFTTLNENDKPFPLADFPKEFDPSAKSVLFD